MCLYCKFIPEQFTVKAQRPLLGVKKGRRGEEEEKSFRLEILWAVQNCIHKWNRTINFFCLAEILGARSQFFKGLFSEFFIFVEKSRELSRTVFKSEIGQKNLFFWGGLFGLLYFRREISVLKWNRTNKNPRIRGMGRGQGPHYFYYTSRFISV